MELSNPDVTQAAADSESTVKTEEANLANLRVTLDSSRLTQRAAVATAQAAYSNAKLDFEVNEELSKSGLVPAITLKQLKTHAEELGSLLDIEQERLKISAEATTAQIAAQEAKLDQVRGQVDLKRRQARGAQDPRGGRWRLAAVGRPHQSPPRGAAISRRRARGPRGRTLPPEGRDQNRRNPGQGCSARSTRRY